MYVLLPVCTRTSVYTPAYRALHDTRRRQAADVYACVSDMTREDACGYVGETLHGYGESDDSFELSKIHASTCGTAQYA